MAHYSSIRGVSSGVGTSSKQDTLGSAFKFDPNSIKYGGAPTTSNSPMAFYTPGRTAPTNSLRGVSSGPGITSTTANLGSSGLGGVQGKTRTGAYPTSGYGSGNQGNTGSAYNSASGGPILANRRLLDNPSNNSGAIGSSGNGVLDYKSRFGKETHSLQATYKPTSNYSNQGVTPFNNVQNPSTRPMTAGRLSEQSNSPQGLSNETYGQLGSANPNRTSSAQPWTTTYSSNNRWANQNRYIASNYGQYTSAERRTSNGLLDGNRVSLGGQNTSKLESSSGFSMTHKYLPEKQGLGISTFNTASKPVLGSELGLNNFEDTLAKAGATPNEGTPAGSYSKYYANFTRHQGLERASKTGSGWTAKRDTPSQQPFEESRFT